MGTMEVVSVARPLDSCCGLRPVLVGTAVWPLLLAPERLQKQLSVGTWEASEVWILRQAGSSSMSLDLPIDSGFSA